MQDNYLKKFGKHIKDIRKKKNLTLSYANYEYGINPSTISRIEKGQVEPKLNTLLKIAEALNINIKDLFNFE